MSAKTVETTGFKERSWLDLLGHPRSESMRITEQYRRRDFGHMDLEITARSRDGRGYRNRYGRRRLLVLDGEVPADLR